jgi:hypothetical protein
VLGQKPLQKVHWETDLLLDHDWTWRAPDTVKNVLKISTFAECDGQTAEKDSSTA